MNQFLLENKQRTALLAGIVLGIVCLGMSWFAGDSLHTRFWTNLLHNTVFFTGLSFMGAFFLAVNITAWAGWYTQFKRVWEAFTVFLIVGAVIMIFIGLGNYFHWHHLYHWADADAVAHDKILNHKAPFLNNGVYLIGSIIVLVAWIFFAYKLRSLSLAEDKDGGNGFAIHDNIRIWAAAFLPFAGFTMVFVIWQWIMSLDAHWYSTLFAWYSGASWFVAMIAMTILVLIGMKNKGYFPNVTTEHIHDLGKLLFGFSIFWTYLWFSQFMLIWYANIGEETVYFQTRIEQYPWLFYGNLAINFLIPFFVLMRNDAKYKFGSVGFVAIVVVFGHWLDYFLMVKPGALHTAQEALGNHGGHGHGHESVAGFTMPGLLEVGIFIGFLSAFLLVTYTYLTKVELIPENDPYIEESLHHHV